MKNAAGFYAHKFMASCSHHFWSLSSPVIYSRFAQSAAHTHMRVRELRGLRPAPFSSHLFYFPIMIQKMSALSKTAHHFYQCARCGKNYYIFFPAAAARAVKYTFGAWCEHKRGGIRGKGCERFALFMPWSL